MKDGVKSVLCLICVIGLSLVKSAQAQEATVSQLATIAKVYIAARSDWSLGSGPHVSSDKKIDIQKGIDEWIRRSTVVDTSVSLAILEEGEVWSNKFVVFVARPRMFHTQPKIVAVAKNNLRVYPLSGFCESKLSDLITTYVQPIATREEALHLSQFCEVVEYGTLVDGLSNTGVLTCIDGTNVEPRLSKVDTIVGIVADNSMPSPVYQEEDGIFIVHLYSVKVFEGTGTVYLVSYVIGRGGVLDRQTVFWCNAVLNTRQHD